MVSLNVLPTSVSDWLQVKLLNVVECKYNVADNVDTQVLQNCTTVQNLSKYVFGYIITDYSNF